MNGETRITPRTYGEHYWDTQTQFERYRLEDEGEELKAYLPNIFADPDIRDSLPFDFLPKWESLIAEPISALGGIGGRFMSQVADQTVGMIMTPALRKTQYAANRLFANMIMTPDAAIGLKKRYRMADVDFDYRLRASGFGEFETGLMEQAASAFPSITDLFHWARFNGDPDNIWGTLLDVYKIDPIDYKLWSWLTANVLGMDQVCTLLHRDKMLEPEAEMYLRKLGWSAEEAPKVLGLSYSLPDAMLLLQSGLMSGDNIDNLMTEIGHAGIHPDYRQKYIDAVLTKPASSDLVRYHLRQENQLADLDNDLQRIGIHPDFLPVYRTLADVIPPVSDIITMAVREAFNPSIAARFGQYEDFPDDFAKYAGMQGLSEEWAQRYWAAHWSLPSPSQGFEMLHRGVIDEADLDMLLKALDVMPFWRDKLKAIAYNPLTRVDVRRMYKEGVLDEGAVNQAYLNIGYSEDDAEALTDFTIKQALSSLAEFTSGDIIKAYIDRKIDAGEARSLLGSIGVRSDDASFILSTADYRREWARVDERTKAIKNLYKRKELTENQARSELLRLNLPTAQVNDLMEQWFFEPAPERPPTYTKAETLKYLKLKLIDETKARSELEILGYDQEHVDTYIRSLTWTPPED